MGTALSIVSSEAFMALQDNSEIKAAMDAAAETGETFGPGDLVRVKTPSGGGTMWSIPAAGKDEQTEEIVGVLVCYQPCAVLWPSEDPAPGTLPVLRTFEPGSPDGVAEQVGPIPDHMIDVLNKFKIDDGPPATFRFAHLPYNQFGSGKRGIGKAVKEQRMLFILRENDMYPILVRAQPGSLKVVRDWFNLLRTSAPTVPYYRCVVSLKLTKEKSKGGQEYSQILPRLVGVISPEAGERIKTMYTDNLKRIVKDIDESVESED